MVGRDARRVGFRHTRACWLVLGGVGEVGGACEAAGTRGFGHTGRQADGGTDGRAGGGADGRHIPSICYPPLCGGSVPFCVSLSPEAVVARRTLSWREGTWRVVGVAREGMYRGRGRFRGMRRLVGGDLMVRMCIDESEGEGKRGCEVVKVSTRGEGEEGMEVRGKQVGVGVREKISMRMRL